MEHIVNTTPENLSEEPSKSAREQEDFDYTFVSSIARIALYDDLRSAPRVTEIMPAPTADYIEALASTIYEQAKAQGGTIPYTVVREVSENFIHARFEEIVVSILDEGNTIRFTDQGPGIKNKDKAQLPGFSSAIEPMKDYIRGVGSGLPIVRDYLEFSHGTISIEDNMGQGAVVTISLKPQDERADAGKVAGESSQNAAPRQEREPLARPRTIVADRVVPAVASPAAQIGYQPASQVQPMPQAMQVQPMTQPLMTQPYAPQPQVYAAPQQQPYAQPMMAQTYAPQPQTYAQPYAQSPVQAQPYPTIPQLNERERSFLDAFLEHGALGVTDISRLTGVSGSTVHKTLKTLEEEGLIEYTEGKKRGLTDFGFAVAESM